MIRERHWFKILAIDHWGVDDTVVVKRTFAKGDLTGARFEMSAAIGVVANNQRWGISAILMDGTIDNQAGWPSLPAITCIGDFTSPLTQAIGTFSDVDFTTTTMTTGDITATAATIAFYFRYPALAGMGTMEHVLLRSIKTMESDGVEKWFASVDASPIEELFSQRYQVFNNEDDSVYYSTRAVDYSTFFELGANPNREFRIVNTRGAEITVTELSVQGSAGAVIDAWVSVKNHGDLPIEIGANASAVASVQVLASDAAIGDFFFVLKATWQGG